MPPTFDPAGEEHLRCPFDTLSKLRAESPIFYLERAHSPMWVVTRYADVKALLSHDALSLNLNDANDYARLIATEQQQTPHQKYMNNNFFALSGAAHRRLRQFTSAGFSPRVLRRMEGEIERIVQHLLTPLYNRHSINFSSAIASPMPARVIAALLRVDDSVVPLLNQLNLDAITPFSTELSDAEKAAAINRFNEHAPVIMQWICQRRAHPLPDDYLSLVLQAPSAGEALSEDGAFGMILALLLTATDTTIDLLNLCMRNVLLHRELRDDVLSSNETLDNFIMESLRHEYFIYAGLGRYAIRDFEYAGHQIKRGQMVRLFVESAMRDETVYQQPEQFNPQREQQQSLVFGHGPHYCVGAALAKLEARTVMRQFFRAFPHARLDGQPDYERHPLARRIGHLPIRLQPEPKTA